MTGGSSLWRHADFLRLWAAQAVSAFGSRITRTALPIIAVTTLDQGAGVVSLLMAMQLGPGIFVGLFADVFFVLLRLLARGKWVSFLWVGSVGKFLVVQERIVVIHGPQRAEGAVACFSALHFQQRAESVVGRGVVHRAERGESIDTECGFVAGNFGKDADG